MMDSITKNLPVKKIALLFTPVWLIFLSFPGVVHAQQANPGTISASTTQKFTVPLKSSTHIISPEPILYADISSAAVEGDLSEKKIFRFKPKEDALAKGDRFTITIVTASFIAVYEMTCSDDSPSNVETYVISIDPTKTMPIQQHGQLNEQALNSLAVRAITKKRGIFNLRANAYALTLSVNNIYIIGDYLLLDVSVRNKSKLRFDLDEIRFKIKDKKILSSTVSQDIELSPEYAFYKTGATPIKRQWRNFYFFRKFTFPSEKIFTIELTEHQISGRKIHLDIDYNQILQATTLD